MDRLLLRPRRACALVVAAWLVAVVGSAAGGEEPGDGGPRDAETSADAAASGDEGGFDPGLVFELGWNEGPTYAVGQTHATLRGRIGGSLFLDGGFLDDAGVDDGWKGEVRRARLYTRGQLVAWAGPEYNFEFSIEDQRFLLNDFYLRWRPAHWLDTIQAGYFDPPLSLSALGSSTARSLMEVAAPVAAFAPGFRLGVGIGKHRFDPDLTWALNLSSIGQQAETGDASRSALRITGRLVWRPWHEEAGPAPSLLHLGLSGSYSLSGEGDLRYRARPESFLAGYLVDTGKFDGDSGLIAVEVAWRRGALSAQAELFHATPDSDEFGSLSFRGATLELSRVLTGESRPYEPSTALFGRVSPRRDFRPREGAWGAVEVTGRLSWVDLSDGPVRGGEMITLNLGVAWTWNRFVRLHTGYVLARTSARPDAGTANIVQGRLELAF